MKRFKHLLFLLSFTLITFYLKAQDFKIPTIEVGKFSDDKIDVIKIIGENEKYFFALSELNLPSGFAIKPPDYFITTIDIKSLSIVEHKPLKKLKIPQHIHGYELYLIREIKALNNGNVLLIFDAPEDKVDYIYSWEYNLETAEPVSEPKLLVGIKNKYNDNLKNADNMLGASFHSNDNNNYFAVSWANYDSKDNSVTLKAIVFDSTSQQINQLNYKLKDTKNCRGVRNLVISDDGSFCASTVYISKSRRYEKTEVYSQVIVVDNTGTQKNIVLELNQGFPTDAKLSIRPDKSILVAGTYFANTKEGYVGGTYSVVVDESKEELNLDTKSMTKVDLQNLYAERYYEQLKYEHLSCLSNLKTWKILNAPDGSSYVISRDLNDEFNLVSQGQFYDSHYNFNLGAHHSYSFVVSKINLEGKIEWIKVIPSTYSNNLGYVSNNLVAFLDGNTPQLIFADFCNNKDFFNGKESYVKEAKKSPFKEAPPYIFTGNEPIELIKLSRTEACFRFTSFEVETGEMLIDFINKKNTFVKSENYNVDFDSEYFTSKSGNLIFLTKDSKRGVVRIKN